MKTVTVGASNAISKIQSIYPDNYHIKLDYTKEFFEDNLLSVNDLYHIQNADVCFLFGTWGSKNEKRQWHPENNLRRQAWLENVNTFFTGIFQLYNKKFIVFETGTLCRIRSAISGSSHWKDEKPLYYRMGLNHWTYGKTTFCKPSSDRLSLFIDQNKHYEKQLTEQLYNHQWKNNENGAIMICPGLENDPTATMPIKEFVDNTYRTLREFTDRKIIVKPHPHTRVDFSKYETVYTVKTPAWDKPALKKIASELYCAVLDNSTSIFELTFLGVPCFTSKANFGYKLGNNNLSKINDIHYNTPEQMREWYNEMAHTEFLLAELENESIKKYIEELVNG